ncbi:MULTISPECIES: hypothetical protein [unclassified Rhizobacter]|uniref:hypothetical protein n=1 Tax=unclassified Rhizobacter TaxID=2640088 RepID=UPI0006F239B2|nr:MULTISPECIES: hypothetical protein [unclassified Rhizobacter]KQU67933.1 hypothetical protein ASC88_08215 [Rhizobacter sp. Root29]KQW15180.1 hypothetical protein ASC98_13700 [Rhizobacter sp. Root1238]KRB24344.1 hypothetical protein ASE08_17685 [Rhizobacter sp. Root16D2]
METRNRYAPPRAPLTKEPALWGSPVSLRARTRIASVAGVAAIAVLHSEFVYSPVAMPWSESVVWGLIGSAASIAGCLVIVSPAWVPMLIPQQYPKIARTAFALCGLILLVAGGGIALAEVPRIPHDGFSFLVLYGLLALVIGACFIWLAASRTDARK